MTAEAIASEWIRMTLGLTPEVETTVTDLLMQSHRIFEAYTAPLGVGLLSAANHYDPDPARFASRFNASSTLVGRDIGASEYPEPTRSNYGDVSTCPDELLLYFHRVPYSHLLHSGKTVLQHIYETHLDGPFEVRRMQRQWDLLKEKIDPVCHRAVAFRLQLQYEVSFQYPSDSGLTYTFQRYDPNLKTWQNIASKGPGDGAWQTSEPVTILETADFGVSIVSLQAPFNRYGSKLLLRVMVQ